MRRRRLAGPDGPRRYEVKSLWDRHHEILRLVLLGFSNKEVAAELGISAQNVSDVKNSQLAIQQLEVLRTARDSQAVDVARAFVEDAPKSLRLLQDIRDGVASQDIKLRAKVAQDLLDRAGHGKVTKIAGRVAHGVFTPEDLDRIKRRARGEAQPQPVNAEFTEVSAEAEPSQERPGLKNGAVDNSVRNLDRVLEDIQEAVK